MAFSLRVAAVVLGVLGAAAAVETAASQAPAFPVFPVRADLVVLQALVKDRAGNHVSGLPADAFAVWEEGQPQTIQFFGREDMPVTIGLVVDTSGSMFSERDSVVAAVGAFGEKGHPADEMFALVFDRRIRTVLPPDLPFTHDALVLRRSLAGAILADGLTAFHDAVLAGLRYARRGSHARRALAIVGDGGDNASAASFKELLARTEASDTTIYTIALVNTADPFAHPRRLRQLARASGGEAFEPRSIRDVENAFRRIASDVRSAYTIGYAPAEPADYGEHRSIRVVARSQDGRTLTVQTRQGYVVEKQ
jgi:Ca-activated chloride channel family protein